MLRYDFICIFHIISFVATDTIPFPLFLIKNSKAHCGVQDHLPNPYYPFICPQSTFFFIHPEREI